MLLGVGFATRFFTFRGCVDRMLTMSLLDYPCTGGFSVKPSAREDTQKRMRRVLHFFGKAAASQALRRSSLVLQLTSGVETFMSTEPAAGGTPIIVELHKGKVHEILNTALQRLLKAIHCVPRLYARQPQAPHFMMNAAAAGATIQDAAMPAAGGDVTAACGVQYFEHFA
jgi:hypothetical protein